MVYRKRNYKLDFKENGKPIHLWVTTLILFSSFKFQCCDLEWAV